MEINNALIMKWEPKIQRKVANTFIVGMDRDDLAQELRMAIMKAAKYFDEDRGISFHTYLHTTMENTTRTLISKAQKRKAELYALPIENIHEDNSAHEGWRDIIDVISHGDWTFAEKHSQIYGYDDIEVENLIKSKNLDDKELKFLDLRQAGMTMEEITDDLKACKTCTYCKDRNYAYCTDKNGESAYKVRQTLRGKFLDLAQEYKLKK